MSAVCLCYWLKEVIFISKNISRDGQQEKNDNKPKTDRTGNRCVYTLSSMSHKNAPPINLLPLFVNKSQEVLSAQALFKKNVDIDLDTIKSQPVQIILNMQNT